MNVRKDGKKDTVSHSETTVTHAKKLKSSRNVEIGWIHSDGTMAKQVRAKQGGGTLNRPSSEMTHARLLVLCTRLQGCHAALLHCKQAKRT